MSYSVKELFYTLQGEGMNAGRAAVFCRFSGCNLWSGHERNRAQATCKFCDTDFVGTDGPGGGTFANATLLARAISKTWRAEHSPARPLIVFTGGEPLLQLDTALIEALHDMGVEIAVETNGTLPIPPGVDHICVSPKASASLVVEEGSELKLVFPQPGAEPEQYEEMGFERFYLQPMDGPNQDENTSAVVRYCLAHPKWRVSLQTHKYMGIA